MNILTLFIMHLIPYFCLQSIKLMKKIWILALCLLMAGGLQAQTVYRSSGKAKYNSKNKKKQQESNRFLDHMIVGGGLSLSLGTYTSVSVSPVVGYRITDNFSAGVGFGYQYLRIKDFFEVDNNGSLEYWDLKANMLSASVWARYIVWRNLFVHAEFEKNFMTFKSPGFDRGGSGNIVEIKEKYESPCVLVGGGYRTPIGDKSSVNFALLYDVLQDKYSPYGNQPFIRIQFLMGF